MWGLHAVAAFAAIQPAIVVIAGYHTVSFGGTTPGTLGQALISAGVVVIGGVWAVLIGWTLLRDESSGPPDPVPSRIVVFYTGALVLLLGGAAYIASTWFSKTTAGWVLLTILLVTRPTYDESRQMIRERGLGTVVGGVIAAVVAVIVSDSTALVAIGTLAMVVAAVLQLQHARYAYFAVFVTAAIVLRRRPAQQCFRDRPAASGVLAHRSGAGCGRGDGGRERARPINPSLELADGRSEHQRRRGVGSLASTLRAVLPDKAQLGVDEFGITLASEVVRNNFACHALGGIPERDPPDHHDPLRDSGNEYVGA